MPPAGPPPPSQILPRHLADLLSYSMSDPRLIVPKVLSELERTEIVQYFRSLDLIPGDGTNCFYVSLSGRPTLFVKVGDKDLLVEASTQSFFYVLAVEDGSAPGIPAVYDAFCEQKYYFLVMEMIDAPSVGDGNLVLGDAVQRVASALEWLFDQQPKLPSPLFGRISAQEACVWHTLFKECEAPVPFFDSKALNKYVNKALSRCPGKKKISISLPDDLSIYHADIREVNFLIDRTGRIWIVDFKYIGLFPKAFQQYAFFSVEPFAAAVGRCLGYELTDTAMAMSRAAVLINQTAGNADMGLDKFGEPIRRQKHHIQGPN